MPSFPARTASSPYRTRTRPALARLVDEVCGTTARLIAYLMALALIAIGGIELWQHLPEIAAAVDPIEIYQAVLHPEGDGQEIPGRSGAVVAPALPGDRAMDAGNLRLRGGL